MEFSIINLGFISTIFAGLVTAFSAYAALTKTKKDDTIAKWLKDVSKRFLSLH